jgi:2,4-dienoyl-CoA reductase (NADPH2)
VATALVGGTEDLAQWRQDWGVGDPALSPGGLAQPDPAPSLRKVWLLQRKAEKPGRGLGRTTGWIHRAHLAAKGVHMLGGVEYLDFSPAGLRIRRDGSEETLPVDDIVFCTGQVAEPRPAAELAAQGIAFHPIGGAAEAQGIDAKRAIEEGVRLALAL